ncbi:MAG: CgeB family protein, partial [Exiguobacterium acetylicum]
MSDQKWKRQIMQQLNWVREEKKRLTSATTASKEALEKLRQLEVLRLPTVRTSNKTTTRYRQNSQASLLNQLDVSEIPVRTTTRYYEKRPIEMAIVCSEFMYAYYEDAVHLHYVNAHTFEEVFEREIDLFLVVSSWKGLRGDDWKGVATPNSKKRQRLLSMMQEVKAKGIPVVFQSTEDPSNHERFQDVAQAADYVLTSDEAMIPEYRVLCGHDRIMAMPFGVNPLIHNPIGATRSRKKGVLFAGSWMAKYPERVKDTEMLFDGVMQSSHELDIVDRNYHLDLPAYQFPERYQSRVAPVIPYDALQQVSKCYDWVLNLNSIKYSKTMCARRVYESQALGNLILSNYSIAVNNEFPNIFTVHDAQEATAIVERTSQEEIERLRAEGLRAVMTEHTVFERMDQILAFIGRVPETRKHRLLIVVAQDGEAIRDVINRQSLTPDEIVSADALTEQTYDKADLVAWMDGKESYGEYYLEDLVN